MKDLTTPMNQEIDLEKAETMKCDECDSSLFVISYVIKKISAIMSPIGEESLVPIQVYTCKSCGEIPKIFLGELE